MYYIQRKIFHSHVGSSPAYIVAIWNRSDSVEPRPSVIASSVNRHSTARDAAERRGVHRRVPLLRVADRLRRRLPVVAVSRTSTSPSLSSTSSTASASSARFEVCSVASEASSAEPGVSSCSRFSVSFPAIFFTVLLHFFVSTAACLRAGAPSAEPASRDLALLDAERLCFLEVGIFAARLLDVELHVSDLHRH